MAALRSPGSANGKMTARRTCLSLLTRIQMFPRLAFTEPLNLSY